MTKPREKTRGELTAEIEDGQKKIRQYENREMVYLSFFKHIPQHEIGRRYGRSRSAAGYHIRKAIRQLYEEMEGMAHEE